MALTGSGPARPFGLDESRVPVLSDLEAWLEDDLDWKPAPDTGRAVHSLSGSWLLVLDEVGDENARFAGPLRLDLDNGDASFSADLYTRRADTPFLGPGDALRTPSRGPRGSQNWYPQLPPSDYVAHGFCEDALWSGDRIEANFAWREWDAGERCFSAERRGARLQLCHVESRRLVPIGKDRAVESRCLLGWFALAPQDHDSPARMFRAAACHTSPYFRGAVVWIFESRLDTSGESRNLDLRHAVQTDAGKATIASVFRRGGLDLDVRRWADPRAKRERFPVLPSYDAQQAQDVFAARVKDMLGQRPAGAHHWMAALVVLSKPARSLAAEALRSAALVEDLYGEMRDKEPESGKQTGARRGALVFHDVPFYSRSRPERRVRWLDRANLISGINWELPLGTALGGTLFFRTALHELGHVFNLKHSTNGHELMTQTGTMLEHLTGDGREPLTALRFDIGDAERSMLAHAPDPFVAPGWADFRALDKTLTPPWHPALKRPVPREQPLRMTLTPHIHTASSRRPVIYPGLWLTMLASFRSEAEFTVDAPRSADIGFVGVFPTIFEIDPAGGLSRVINPYVRFLREGPALSPISTRGFRKGAQRLLPVVLPLDGLSPGALHAMELGVDCGRSGRVSAALTAADGTTLFETALPCDAVRTLLDDDLVAALRSAIAVTGAQRSALENAWAAIGHRRDDHREGMQQCRVAVGTSLAATLAEEVVDSPDLIVHLVRLDPSGYRGPYDGLQVRIEGILRELLSTGDTAHELMLAVGALAWRHDGGPHLLASLRAVLGQRNLPHRMWACTADVCRGGTSRQAPNALDEAGETLLAPRSYASGAREAFATLVANPRPEPPGWLAAVHRWLLGAPAWPSDRA